MQTILTITDWVLFALLGFATAYLFIFALASMRRRRDRFPAARIEHSRNNTRANGMKRS